MQEAAESFPLHWPVGFERSKSKKYSSFKCTLVQARDGVLEEIRRLKGTNVVISTNIPVKRDGNLYASMKTVDGDEGVAVYFTWKGEQYVLACDCYYKIHENLRAIEKSIEAIRGLDRWGASDILARAFTGFKALPETNDNWWTVLGVRKVSDEETIKRAYRDLVKKYHPDNGDSGDHEMFIKIQNAYELRKVK